MDTSPTKPDTELFMDIRQALKPWMTWKQFLGYLAWEQAYYCRLSCSQRKALEDLCDQLQCLVQQPWAVMRGHISGDLMGERDAWYDDLRKVIKVCYNAGLRDHPFVALWIA